MRKSSGAAWPVALKHADYGPATYAAGRARDDGAGGCVAARITRSSLSAPPQCEQTMGYLLLAVVAIAGLLASAACHLMGWFHVEPPWGKSVFVLHVGLLILWFPLVIFANRTMPKAANGNLEHLLAELPKWMRHVVTVLFVYTLLNFAYFIYCTSQYPRHGVPFYMELRGFSGHLITIRLDEESITYFKAISEDVGVPYQSLINLYLRDCAISQRDLTSKCEKLTLRIRS